MKRDLTFEAWQRLAGREPVQTHDARLDARLEGDMEPVCAGCGSYRAPVGTFPNYRCVDCGRDL